jgi:hypothetical protein
MRKIVAVFLCLCLGSIAWAQDPGQAQAQDSKAKQALLKEFSRSERMGNVVLSFVLLNSKTVEVLFSAPGKFAMQARANQATTFYVVGKPDKDITLDTNFVVEQDGQTINGSAVNIKNFEAGPVSKGQRIDGIFQLERKIDVTHAFKIKGSKSTLDFKLSSAALKELEN